MQDNTEDPRKALSFYGSDPGAVKHVPRDNQLVCLDIGCNTGDLTKAVHDYLKSMYPNTVIHILAIDIDPVLIQRALESADNSNITFTVMNIMSESERVSILNFLNKHRIKMFDIVFCFSVTMWIHLNNGDEGLLEFLRYLKSISKTIIIEPQPWKCYRNAQRRIKKSGNLFELYTSLKITNEVDNVIENMLINDSYCKIYESPNSSWDRKIKSFQSINNSGTINC